MIRHLANSKWCPSWETLEEWNRRPFLKGAFAVAAVGIAAAAAMIYRPNTQSNPLPALTLLIGSAVVGGAALVAKKVIKMLASQIKDIRENTSHLLAIRDNNPVLAKRLIELGVSINTRNFEGQTVLLKCARLAPPEAALACLELGADPHIGDNKGDTPLLYAIQTNKLVLVRRLIELGADPNLPNNKGITPLRLIVSNSVDVSRIAEAHFAISDPEDQIKILDLLLEAGADALIIDEPVETSGNEEDRKHQAKVWTIIKQSKDKKVTSVFLGKKWLLPELARVVAEY